METSIFFIAVQILVVLFSIVLHEVAHGAMANHLGDPTAKNLGRLTLNPFKHLDLFGSVLLPLMTFFIVGFFFFVWCGDTLSTSGLNVSRLLNPAWLYRHNEPGSSRL